jgi:hypothetical protein
MYDEAPRATHEAFFIDVAHWGVYDPNMQGRFFTSGSLGLNSAILVEAIDVPAATAGSEQPQPNARFPWL